jgi:lysophospholipase L1-like esterase
MTPKSVLALSLMKAVAACLILARLLVADHAVAASEVWNRAWTASLWQGNEGQVLKTENQTIRMQIRIGSGGKSVRLRLANDFGQAAVAIGAVTVVNQAGRRVQAVFAGEKAASIPAGGILVSDPVKIPVEAFELLTISIYLPGQSVVDDLHVDRANRLEVSEQGDLTHHSEWLPQSTSEYRPLLAGIDVLGSRRPIVVAFGDSITDAPWCSHTDQKPCRWSEVLGRRLALTRRPHIVVNQGISGNRVLTKAGGHSALARFDRDVLSIPGVTHLVLLIGINDIASFQQTGITSRDIVEGLRQLAFRAREHDIKVTALTLLPFKGSKFFSQDTDKLRQDVNAWIVSSQVFDYVVRIDRDMADPVDHGRLKDMLQSGDGLHPSELGQRVIGEAIPLGIFNQ